MSTNSKPDDMRFAVNGRLTELELRALLEGEARQVFQKFWCAFMRSASGSPREAAIG
ncbi:MAG: hypothetical protein ACLQUY_12390 [Ktedonobacterales bacterium]